MNLVTVTAVIDRLQETLLLHGNACSSSIERLTTLLMLKAVTHGIDASYTVEDRIQAGVVIVL